MGMSEEKLAIFQKINQYIMQPGDNDDCTRELHSLLMKDSCNGKLYKYRSFDPKGFSLKNFEEGTLHCSEPDKFNDPFDCRVGTTIQQVLTDYFTEQRSQFLRVLVRFARLLSGLPEIKSLTSDEKEILRCIGRNPRLLLFAKEYGIPILSAEKRALIERENIDEVLFLSIIILSNHNYGDKFPFILHIVVSIYLRTDYNEIINTNELAVAVSIQKLLSSYGIQEDADSIALYSRLMKRIGPEYSTQVNELENSLNKIMLEIFNGLCSGIRVGCLCTDCKNTLMWSHYAEGHSGFCIEYDFSNSFSNENSWPLYPVIYSENRPKVFLGQLFNQTEGNMRASSKSLFSILLTKDSVWRYENEWRVLADSQNSSEVKMPPISCVYIGAMADKEQANKLRVIAHTNNIPVKKMVLDRGTYELHVQADADSTAGAFLSQKNLK